MTPVRAKPAPTYLRIMPIKDPAKFPVYLTPGLLAALAV